jgi:hypothetical protein
VEINTGFTINQRLEQGTQTDAQRNTTEEQNCAQQPQKLESFHTTISTTCIPRQQLLE